MKKKHIKIEMKSLPFPNARNRDSWQEFLTALKNLKIGQSFLLDKCGANHRIILSACKVLIDAHFITRKENNMIRIGRVG